MLLIHTITQQPTEYSVQRNIRSVFMKGPNIQFPFGRAGADHVPVPFRFGNKIDIKVPVPIRFGHIKTIRSQVISRYKIFG